MIHRAHVPVLPVFINGLLPKNLPRQIRSNYDGTGEPIHIVFGKPIDFRALRDERPSPRVFKTIADRTVEVIHDLGQEEKLIRGRPR